ncbi:DNA methylase [Spirochaetota bacterium]|nr:DNA methylase [Spirochaetota bacterium]
MKATTPKRARNKTITLTSDERATFKKHLLRITEKITQNDLGQILNKTICQSLFEVLPYLPAECVDLVFVDPPYNCNKTFNGQKFRAMDTKAYENWLDTWLSALVRVLKKKGSIYICGDWRSSAAVVNVAEKYLKIHNRITFEREKGRGAKRNWKNCSEDIWFGTVGDDYYFNVDAVMHRKEVIAPYTDKTGEPKDWQSDKNGRYRLTHPSNIWTDITVPFWSMAENTDHPTQKSEKLLAKIILASSRSGDIVLDPFLGSGTTSVVAYKLGRRYLGIEQDEYYACLAEKRIANASANTRIQGYTEGVFWGRNTPS